MEASISRRGFLTAGMASGIAYSIRYRTSAEAAMIDASQGPDVSWQGPRGEVRFRADAVAKVTGAKTFSRDFRASDMEGWPAEQSHAFAIGATRADAVFLGLDLSPLGPALQPDRLVLGDELLRDGLKPPGGGVVGAPGFYGDVLLVPPGMTPRLLGQPVALLIYHDFPRFNAARRKARFSFDLVRWGPASGYDTPPDYGAARYVRIEGATPTAPDVYAPLTGTTVYADLDGGKVAWPKSDPAGDAAQRAMWAAGEIERRIAAPPPDAIVLQRSYFSQSVDASAMEADNGNGWLDPVGTLHLMLATQSPFEVATAAASMLAGARIRVKSVDLTIGYTVGYGTKDHSMFPYISVVAALYGEGRPVRLANDRFGQFQMGLKRHSVSSDLALVVDRGTHRFLAMRGAYRFNGGGRRNFSPEIGAVGASAAQGVYYLPSSDFAMEARASRAVDAGSTRGFGTLQTMTATEMLVDELAEALSVDAIELRRVNLMRSGMRNSQGAVPAGALRAPELLDRAAMHPLWRNRARAKRAYEEESHPGRAYGVGFAIVQKDYGSGAEAAIVSLELSPTGALAMRHGANEIGTGMTTSQAVLVQDVLGKVPEKMTFGVTEWPEMPVVSDNEPFSTSQDREDALARDPYWTPLQQTPMSASNSAYFQGHATRLAAETLLRVCLWPAALSIWSSGGGGGQIGSLAVDVPQARMVDGMLTAGGLEPLAIGRLAATAHESGGVTGVSVHTFNRWAWAEAEFEIPTIGARRLAADALSVRLGDGAFRFLERRRVAYPPVSRLNAAVTYYSGMANLVEVAVETATGKVAILSHHSILECGNQLVPQLVSGQIQGGVAMGIGHALLESLPLYEDGPGNGTWNWNRYRLPRAADVAVWRQSAEVLPALSATDPPKGIAEVVMIAIVPAIANAVAHAIGKRFYATPITPSQILEAIG